MGYLKDELAGFVPTEQATDIARLTAEGSAILRVAKVEPMNSDTKKVPVQATGVGAYWVGEGERIQTSKPTWIFPEITAKKLAVIIPVTKEKLNDSTINVFNEAKPMVAEAFYNAIDSAVFFGTNSPFAKNIVGVATASGNTIADGTSASLDLDVSDLMALLEEDGHDVNGFVAKNGIKNRLRKLRDTSGNQLFVDGVNGRELYNQSIEFVRKVWDNTKAELIAGAWEYALVGVRQGIEYEVLREATLQGTLDADGKPLSLAEQDMIALKCTMRIGFLPVKDDAFAVLTPDLTP